MALPTQNLRSCNRS